MVSIRTRIGSVELESFRGIRSRKALRFQGKSLLLFGENGTGKSSFVEGLERVLTGRVSTLDGRGQGISSDRHSIHVLDSKPDASVVLTNGDLITLSGVNTKLSPLAQSYAAAGQVPDHFILRRSKVLRFVEAVPKDRYELLRPFLPLMEVSSFETSLAAAVQNLETVLTKAKFDERTARDDIARLPGIELIGTDLSPGTILAALQSTLSDLMLSPVSDLSAIPNLQNEIDTSIDKVQAKLATLSQASGRMPDLSPLRSLGEHAPGLDTAAVLAALQDERAKSAAVVDEASAAMKSALADISVWIEDNAPLECPVCEQPIDPQRVSARIKLKVASVNELLRAQALRRSRQQELETAVQSAQNAVVRAFSRPTGVADEWWDSREIALRDINQKLGAAKCALKSEADWEFLTTRSLADVRTGLSRIAGDATQPITSPDAGESTSLKVRLTKLYQLQSTIPQLEPLLAVMAARMNATREATRRAAVARRALIHLQDARKNIVQEIYSELAGDIDDIYSRVHPDESVGDISLDVKTSGQGSANLRGRFHDRKGQDPRAYFSEAHLDTLGISVFLALRKRLLRVNPDFDLLVLDDVLTSVDAPHASRFADVLLTDFSGCQLLITTHSRIWYEHLRGLIAGKGLDQAFAFLAIHRWSLEDGPDIRDFVEQRDELEAALKNGSPASMAGSAGRLLENLLLEMRFELGLAVPAKRGERYTLMDLWPAFKKRINKDFRGVVTQCGAQIADIERLWFTRNWVGAHFNEWAEELSAQDAQYLAIAVLDLFDCLRCPQCLRFVTRSEVPVGQLACKRGCTVIFEPKTTK